MNVVLTVHRIYGSISSRYVWVLMTGDGDLIDEGLSLTHKSARRKAMRSVQSLHRPSVTDVDIKAIEMYANGQS